MILGNAAKTSARFNKGNEGDTGHFFKIIFIYGSKKRIQETILQKYRRHGKINSENPSTILSDS